MSGFLAGYFLLSRSTPDARILPQTWEAYKSGYILEDGRVIDPWTGGVTTSEGEAYAMVRALWMDDRVTFDRVLGWTVAHLQHGDPSRLPAWKWGPRTDGTWGVADEMPAADADQWMAWALLVAGERWGRPSYDVRAQHLLAGIWDEETIEIGADRVVVPGPWAKITRPLRLNPSYWLPFAWRRFATADPSRPWDELIDPAYELWQRCRSPDGLPPDWCSVDAVTGEVRTPTVATDEDFGFEAFRIGWTLAAEARWYRDPRAEALLSPFVALEQRWRRDHYQLPGVIGQDGGALREWEYPGMYGALLPVWRPMRARSIYVRELERRRAQHGWGDPRDYYGQNWIWMGMALWSGVATPS